MKESKTQTIHCYQIQIQNELATTIIKDIIALVCVFLNLSTLCSSVVFITACMSDLNSLVTHMHTSLYMAAHSGITTFCHIHIY